METWSEKSNVVNFQHCTSWNKGNTSRATKNSRTNCSMCKKKLLMCDCFGASVARDTTNKHHQTSNKLPNIIKLPINCRLNHKKTRQYRKSGIICWTMLDINIFQYFNQLRSVIVLHGPLRIRSAIPPASTMCCFSVSSSSCFKYLCSSSHHVGWAQAPFAREDFAKMAIKQGQTKSNDSLMTNKVNKQGFFGNPQKLISEWTL